MTRYPNASFPLLDDVAAIQRLRTAVERGRPFSLVRLGDGEGVAMSIGDSSWLQDLGYLRSHWGAERVPLGYVARVRDDLRAAIRGADLVGIRPDLVDVVAPNDLLDRPLQVIADFVRTQFALRDAERHQLSPSGARRLALLHRELSRFAWDSTQEFCSQWIHWELLAHGTLAAILADLDEVGIVTAKSELPGLLAERFDLRVRAVMVPDKFIDSHRSGAHVPDRYVDMKPELDVPEGTVVLVGAGIPGKAYCQWVKEAGGIGVDVGSVMDAWIGKASRPLVMAARFDVPSGGRVPPDLQIRKPQASEIRRLRPPRWKPHTTLTEHS